MYFSMWMGLINKTLFTIKIIFNKCHWWSYYWYSTVLYLMDLWKTFGCLVSEVILYSFNAIRSRKIICFLEFWGSGFWELKGKEKRRKIETNSNVRFSEDSGFLSVRYSEFPLYIKISQFFFQASKELENSHTPTPDDDSSSDNSSITIRESYDV